MKIRRFEDLECWQEARKLTAMVYSATKDGSFARDYQLRDQIAAAAISVMNNIAEGFASQSNSEFIRFLTYSRRSAMEVQSCAYIALDQGYLTRAEFEQLYQQAEKTIQIFDGFLRYLRAYQRTLPLNALNALNEPNGC